MRPRPVIVPGRPRGGLPYSPGMIVGNLVFVSGHAGRVPGTREVPESIAAQTAQALENVKAVLEAAGSTLEDVCKVNVFLANVNDFAAMNEVYRRYFPSDPPARSTIGVVLAEPGLLIEIEAAAMLPDDRRT